MLNRQPLPAARQQPTHVGRYRLLSQIGEGGMGVVHLAEARGGSQVALKVLRPHVIGDDEARERLAREVAALRRVTSPRVAEVLDADPWGETPFVATRHVAGPSLHEQVREHGPITGPDLAHFAAALAEAVVAVHRVGVLHRDIKPSNVLLEGRSPVLIDFGLARLAEDPRLTQTGWLLGTPGYLAPEILYGDDATTASDVHSWAATVVFAATGRPPFGTGPAMAIMDRVRRGEHDLSAVPPMLLPLVRACLAADPADRPGIADVLASLDRAAPTTRPMTVPTQRPEPRAVPRLPRTALLLGLFVTVTLGFARAPYLSLLVLGVVVLLVRTFSWTSESARDRQQRRGRRRWYDGPLTLASTPWYLVVASAGTVVLLLCAATVALMVALAYLLFRGSVLPGLLLTGATLTLSLWWGPGSRRLRVPLRRLAARSGWTSGSVLFLAAVATAAALLAYSLATAGVLWTPAPGAPWRPGTPLGSLLRWF